MDPKTTREADERAHWLTSKAEAAEGRAKWSRGDKRGHEETAARVWHAEAARLRALIPNLPD